MLIKPVTRPEIKRIIKFEALNTDDVKARVFGDTAVVTGRATVKGQVSGQHISGQYRYMRVFVRQQGQ